MKDKSRIVLMSEKKIARKNLILGILVVLLVISLMFNYSLINYIKNDGSAGGSELDRIVDKIVSNDNQIDEESNSNDGNTKDIKRKSLMGTSITDKSEIYDVLYGQIIEGNTEINISFPSGSLSIDDVYEVYLNILKEHPELFWLNGGAQSTGYSWNSFYSYKIELDTTVDMDKVNSMRNELETEVEKIVTEAKVYDSDYDKVKHVHDAIVRECDYDTESYDTLMAKGNDMVDPITYTAYGCLVNKKSVCNGYAKAFQLIMNKLDIECGCISGTAINKTSSGPHAWNYALVDGKYVYIDVTWDDPVYEDGSQKPSEISRDYFCISLNEISRDHFADEGEYLP